MDKLRSATASVVAGVTRARPAVLFHSLWSRASTGQESERGQGLAEYALILAGIAVVAIASLMFLGSVVNGLFVTQINAGFDNVVTNVLGL